MLSPDMLDEVGDDPGGRDHADAAVVGAWQCLLGASSQEQRRTYGRKQTESGHDALSVESLVFGFSN